jgi:RalA-binding protein 1
MDESLQLLQSSPDAAPTDAYFCHLVWTHHLSEEVGVQFSLDDPTTDISMNDPRTQYILKGLEQELKRYKEKVPPDLLQRKPSIRPPNVVLSTDRWQQLS